MDKLILTRIEDLKRSIEMHKKYQINDTEWGGKEYDKAQDEIVEREAELDTYSSRGKAIHSDWGSEEIRVACDSETGLRDRKGDIYYFRIYSSVTDKI